VTTAGIVEPPDGLAVERLAVVMAAANGFALLRLDDAARAAYRRSANGALLHLALTGPVPGHLKGAMTDIAEALRKAAVALDYHDAREDVIQGLHRKAAQAEVVASVFGVNAEEPEEVV
jgi:hypothetical protein